MSFLNPLFLFGGLTVAVPILLHFIRRQNARKVEFPTLMFLRKIDKRVIRYQKLRHLLLLLLRILAFLLLVFAFMRPYSEEAPVSAAVMGRTVAAHILAVDNSMSMSYRDRWDRAQDAAADIVRRSNGGDKFAVLEFSDSSVIRTSITSDASVALKEIEDIPEPGDRPTRYDQALRAAEGIAREAGTAERTIHLISDFQKSGLTDEAREFQLEAGIGLQCVDLGSNAFGNLAIQNVRTLEQDRSGVSDLRIQASIVEFGVEDRENVPVRLTMDGRKISEKKISVDKNSSEEIEFEVQGLKQGEHPAVLEIDDSYLERDNRFYMTVDVRGKTPVLLVEEPALPGQRSPGFFLDRALNVDRLSPYEVKTVSPRETDFAGKLLIWNSVPAPAVRKRLEDFVKDGGGMILILGNSKNASEFNRVFGDWLPVTMKEVSSGGSPSRTKTERDYLRMTDIRADHPIFQPFDRPHSGIFSSARFYEHARIDAGPRAEILASFENGDPALVSARVEKGRILIFASSADDSGNDLPLRAVYAPFWQQMLRYLESYEEKRYWLEIGDVIDPGKILSAKAFRGEKAAPATGDAFAVLDPAGQRLEIPPGSGGIVAEKAGFYEIRTQRTNTSVAVNTTAAESDLTHQDAEEMTSSWVSTDSVPFPMDEDATAEEKGRAEHIWVFLLLAALLLLISESLLSGRGVKEDRDKNLEWTTRNA